MLVSERLVMDDIVQIARYAGGKWVLRLTGACLLTLFFAIASPAHSTHRPTADLAAVDLQLILAVDVSPSMSKVEQKVQRDGYVGAFRHADIARALKSGERGRIAVLYLEWAGPNQQTVVMPWTIVESLDDALILADRLAALPLTEGRGTSISGALSAANALFAKSGLRSPRRVIDLSGDGPNNAGLPLQLVHDALITGGVTVNGLAISLRAADTLDSFGPHFIELYYESCVIGGSDAFVVTVENTAGFANAIRKKLVNEIAGLPAFVQPATYRSRSRPVVDCDTIGETPGR
ncbi:hypothetical protein MesoLj113a_65610 [Mesorhizobium sp. 113-1-2]|nr:hypothetical protein MLTONO_5966 [Mesorhizobium loti]BCG75403.1 hypothetical protein MesoLj113a_65610 [Mesorhizobium sp. 113-1-2]